MISIGHLPSQRRAPFMIRSTIECRIGDERKGGCQSRREFRSMPAGAIPILFPWHLHLLLSGQVAGGSTQSVLARRLPLTSTVPRIRRPDFAELAAPSSLRLATARP